ncbi:MAG: hypothetical protein RIS82_1157 [Actinomycetota bacterium]|jgi:hypothetical protein
MGLSEREQRLLEEMERSLYATDADLANKLSRPVNFSPKRIIAGGAITIIGVSLLIVAVMLQFALFGVVGFLVMLTGLVLASSNIGVGAEPAGKTTSKSPGQSKPKQSFNKSFFEDRWDKRQGN